MKIARVLLLLAVLGFCLWMVLPQALPITGGGDQPPSPTPQGGRTALSAVPVPDLTAIQPASAPAQPAADGPAATPAPEADPVADAKAVAMDLWLDASPNVGGVAALNQGYNGSAIKPYYDEIFTSRGDNYKGVVTGGFLYQVSGEKGLLNDKDKEIATAAQNGWYAALLDCLWNSEVVAQTGRVRVLRYAEDAMLPDAALADIVTLYGQPAAALRREAMTYAVYEDKVARQGSFFLRLLGDKATAFFENRVKKVAAANNFFTPGLRDNNRLLQKSEGFHPTSVEVADTQARAALSAVLDTALDAAAARLTVAEGQAAPAAAASAITGDYFLYALQNLDPTHLNVLTLDTLGLPEMDAATAQEYRKALQKLIKSQPDLAVCTLVCRLDYAGIITNVMGHTLQCGLDWGFLARMYSDNNMTNIRFAFTLPMPRTLLVVVVGPGASTAAYLQRLQAKLDAEMQAQNPNNNDVGTLSGERGDARRASGYQAKPAYMYLNTETNAPSFAFAYQAKTMVAMDVAQRQAALAAGILAKAQQDLRFTQGNSILRGGSFTWAAQQGAQTVEADVPIVPADFSAPVTVAVDVSAMAGDEELPTLAVENLTVGVQVGAGLTLRTLDLDGLPAGSLPSENDQAYVDPADDHRVYVYASVAQANAPQLTASGVTLEGGTLRFTLSAAAPPTPGYYWITLTMDYRTDPNADETLWNEMPAWAEANATLQQEGDPAAFATSGTWDYTPTDVLSLVLEPDAALATAKTAAIQVPNGGVHAYGAGAKESGAIFPASVPPVFRAFQLHSLLSALREGLFIRPEAGASSRVLTRQFILYVPLAD